MEFSTSCYSTIPNQSNLICTRSQGNSFVCNSDNCKKDRKRSSDNDSVVFTSTNKRKRTTQNHQDLGDGKLIESDTFCWICHCEGPGVSCDLCPRFYHIKCLMKALPTNQWICPECQKAMTAEAVETKSEILKLISIDTLCILLRYVLQRMKLPETKPFHHPVDCANLPTYTDFIFHPMDFATIDRNIKRQVYGSTEAFIADVKWILHNCIIFNGKNHPLTSVAKSMFKICCHETTELQICPDCYLNSCVKENDDWFCEPCRRPHSLVWAKMKGYPFWPAKVLREENSQVDVRFFGEHDRAWVSLGQVFLLSQNPPGSVPKKTKGFGFAKSELNRHLELLKEKFGNFSYAPDKTLFISSNILKHEDEANSSNQISTPAKSSKISNKLLMKRKFSQPKHFSLKRNFVRSNEIKERRTSKRRQSQLNLGSNNDDDDDDDDDGSKVRDDSKKIVLKINKVHLFHSSTSKCKDIKTNGEIYKNADCKYDKDEFEDFCEVLPVKDDDDDDDGEEKEANIRNDESYVREKVNAAAKLSNEVGNTSMSDSNNIIGDGGNKSNNLNAQFINSESINKTLQKSKQDDSHYETPDKISPILPQTHDSAKKISKEEHHHEHSKPMEAKKNDRTFEIDRKIHDKEIIIEDGLKSRFDGNLESYDEKSSTFSPPLNNNSLLRESHTSNNDVITGNNKQGGTCAQCEVGRSTTPVVEGSLNESEIFKRFKVENTGIDMKKYVKKMFLGMQDVLSEIVEDLLNPDKPNVLHNFLVEEIKKIKQSHNAELEAVKHSSALQIAEMRLLHQFEKKKFESIKAQQILNLKTTFWCANCMKEAAYNCCWKANYCSTECQKNHWSKHIEICANCQEFVSHLDSPAVSKLISLKKPIGMEQKMKLKLQNPVRPIQLVDGNKNVSNLQHVGIPSVMTSMPSYLLQHSVPLQGPQHQVLSQQHLHQQFVIQASNACGYVPPIKPCVIAPLQKMPPS